MKEALIARALAIRNGGCREKRVPCGRVDVVTPREIIEVKRAAQWKQGMGQLLAYSEHFPKTMTKRLHLYGKHCVGGLHEAKQTCKSYNVRLTSRK